MKKTKPVIVIYLRFDGLSSAQILQNIEQLQKQLGPIEDDYYSLILPAKEFKVEVFYEKDYQREPIENLKESIKKHIKEQWKT